MHIHKLQELHIFILTHDQEREKSVITKAAPDFICKITEVRETMYSLK